MSRFPAGLFWLHSDGTAPSTRVTALIDRAVALGVDAHLVSIATFTLASLSPPPPPAIR